MNLDAGMFYDNSGVKHDAGSLDRKLLFAEWNWHGYRPAYAPNVQWHNPGGSTRQMNTQFGDGHAEYYSFSALYEAQAGNIHRAPNPADEIW